MTPFEIRTKLIEQSEAYLRKQFEINTEFAKQVFDELVKQGEKVQADWLEYAPKMYTYDDVLKQAQKLYGFVSNAK